MSKEEQDPEGPSPTDSHVLSRAAEHEDTCISPNSSDIIEGWSASAPQDLDERIIPSLPNEDLWMLIRRFNKVRCPAMSSLSQSTEKCRYSKYTA